MDNRIAVGVISVFVVLVVIGSALTPMIDAYTTTTTTIENEGAVGLRMEKVTSGDFTLNYGLVGDDFTATNGTDTQIIDDMCIFYADDNVAVWMDDSNVRMLGKNANDQTIDAALSDEATITITKSANGVIITDGTVDQIFPVPAWSYIPKSTGAYGFFLNETEINTGGLDVHYVGSFAGVNCYDSINTYDLPITLDATVTDSTLTGAKWIKAASAADPEAEVTPFEPGSLTPLDPGVISLDPEPDASIMSVPTPTYTEGDWGYDTTIVGGVTKAIIVSYSGSGGNIVIPATIGGYDVAEIGKGGTYNIIDNSAIQANSTLTISGAPTAINGRAFNGCSNLTGTLVIPESVTTIGESAFYYCKFSGTLVIPESVTSAGNHAFRGFNIDTLVIKSSSLDVGSYGIADLPNGVNLISLLDSATFNSSAFSNAKFTTILDLGDFEFTTTTGGLANVNTIDDKITALGYLAAAQYSETVTDDGPVAALLKAIPLIAIIAVVMMAVGVFIARRM